MTTPVNHLVLQNFNESVANLRSQQQQEGIIDEGKPQTTTEARGSQSVKLSARDILAMLSTRRIDMDDIKFTGDGLQGRGGKGDVVVATIPTHGSASGSGETVAVKQLRLSDGIDQEKFLRGFVNELRVVDGLSHLNIVKIIGFVEDTEKSIYWLVFPWEANGNVREFLLSGEWELPERVSLIQDVASGLEYLHTRQPPICHGDLKSLNVLVNADYRAVITDFGSARVLRRARSLETHPAHGHTVQAHCEASRDNAPLEVTLSAANAELTLTGPSWSFRWAAPEVLNEAQSDLASDIWALGWIAWEIITDNYPFPEAKTQQHITIKVVTGQLPSIYKNSQLSQVAPLCHLMVTCWKLEPKDRPSAVECQRALRWIPSFIPAMEGGGGSKIRSAALLQEIGTMHRLHNRNEEASRMFEEGLAVARSTGDDPAIASLLLHLGTVQAQRFKYAEAETSFTQSLDIFEYIGDDLGRANALYGLGEIHAGRYSYANAKEFYTQAQTIYTNIEKELGRADALQALGRIYEIQNQYAEAEGCHTSALALYTNLGEERGTAGALHHLGSIHEAYSRYDKAEESYTQALTIRTNIGDALGRANELYSLGGINEKRSNYTEAEEFYTRALNVYTSIGNAMGRAIALYGLGGIHAARSNDTDAEESYTQALEISTSIADDYRRTNTSINLSKIRLRQGRYAEAKNLINDAAVISDRIKYPWGQTTSQQLLLEVVAAERSTIESPSSNSAPSNPTAGKTMAATESSEATDP